MPHANDVVPRSLSSDSVRVGKAGASLPPIDMSDLSDSGTAAAAAALGRLLASGDHEMQSEEPNIPQSDPAGPSTQHPERLTKFRKLPDHLRSYLAQAAVDIAEGREPAPMPAGLSPLKEAIALYRAAMQAAGQAATDEDADRIDHAADAAFCMAARAAFPLATIGDAQAAVEWVLGDLREHAAEPDLQDYERLYLELLGEAVRVLGNIVQSEPQAQQAAAVEVGEAAPKGGKVVQPASTIIPHLGMTFVEAKRKLDALIAAHNVMADDATNEELGAHSDLWQPLECAIFASTPVTLADAIVLLEIVINDLPDPLRTDGQDMKCLPRVLAALTKHRDAAQVLPVEHPDRALLEAWAGYVKAMRDHKHFTEVVMPNGTDEDYEPYSQVIDALADRIIEHRASTVEGFAVQLRYLFAAWIESADAERAAIYDEPVTEDLAEVLSQDYRERMLWEIAQAATQASRVDLLGSAAGGGAGQSTFKMLCQDATDAELIDATVGWMHLAAAFADDFGEDRDPTEQELTEIERLEDLIAFTPCTAAAGALAKAVRLTDCMIGAIPAIEPGGKLEPLLNTISLPEQEGPVATLVQQLAKNLKAIIQDQIGHLDLACRRREPAQGAVGNTDAELLAAFEEWRAAGRAVEFEGTEGAQQRVDAATDRLLGFIPTTIAGAVALLRFLFAKGEGGAEAEHAILNGVLPGEDFIEDFRDGVVWRLIRGLEGIALQPANDQPGTSNPFAGAVAAFEAEAPATLSVPQQPTGGMVEAGATAAGITPEQFQAAYAAAVEALKKERAA